MKKILSVFLVIAMASCSWLKSEETALQKKCADPANAGSLECAIVNDVLDCTSGILPSVEAALMSLADLAFKAFILSDGTLDLAAVKAQTGSMPAAYGECLLGNLEDKYTNAPPKLAPGEVRVVPSSFRDALNQMRATAPTHKVKTAGGVK